MIKKGEIVADESMYKFVNDKGSLEEAFKVLTS